MRVFLARTNILIMMLTDHLNRYGSGPHCLNQFAFVCARCSVCGVSARLTSKTHCQGRERWHQLCTTSCCVRLHLGLYVYIRGNVLRFLVVHTSIITIIAMLGQDFINTLRVYIITAESKKIDISIDSKVNRVTLYINNYIFRSRAL